MSKKQLQLLFQGCEKQTLVEPLLDNCDTVVSVLNMYVFVQRSRSYIPTNEYSAVVAQAAQRRSECGEHSRRRSASRIPKFRSPFCDYLEYGTCYINIDLWRRTMWQP